MRLAFTFILFTFFVENSFSQQLPVITQQAEQELSQKGISDKEFKTRMKSKGYDLDNIQPEQIPYLEKTIEETLNELEEEKGKIGDNLEEKAEVAVEAAAEKAEESTDEIEEAVREGASLEEAISEELSDEAKKEDPPATIYGQHIFRDQSLEVYRSAKDIKPPSTYVLGSGDELTVSIFGVSQGEFAFTVNEKGYIQPSRMPRIYLKGVTLKKAESLIRQRFAQFYVFQPEQFSLTVNTARTITVNIFGEVQNFGSFTISAINTAFNALVAAGGPTNIGTIRKIKLIRGREIKEIDTYKFLFDPTVQFDFFLQNNDIIHVPTSEKLVSITGGVKRPFQYELLEEENLKSLIQFAGGLNVGAYKENIQITRIVNEQKVIIDVNLNTLINNNTDFDLHNGDVINIRSIPGRLESFTSIEGEVEFPDRYELVPNMRISDLIQKSILKEGARTDVAFLLRQNPDATIRLIKVSIDSILQNPNSFANILLQKKDKLTIYSQKKFIDNYSISVSGAVRNPITYPFDPTETITVQDAIILAGGLKENVAEIGYIKRIDTKNNKIINYIPINLIEALSNNTSIENRKLQPKDQLITYTTERFSDAANVSISGEVRDPGAFDYATNLRISDVIYLSGGLTQDATDFAFITRKDLTNPDLTEYIRIDLKEVISNPSSNKNILLFPYDKIEVMSNAAFTDVFSIKVEGAVRNPGAYQYDESLNLKDVLTMAGGLKLNAANNKIDIFRVVINENQPTQTVVATVEVDQDYNVLSSTGGTINLEPFDIIAVRSVPDFELQQIVKIEGEVLYPGNYALIKDNEKLVDLIKRAGGLTAEAFAEGAKLTRIDNNTGAVIIELDNALKKENSRFNYILKKDDVISIPKSKDLVTININATLAAELYPDKFLQGGKLSVAYKKGKRAEWYIDEYAAGIDTRSRARRRYITVEYPNGKINRVKGLLFTPKVKKGSIVNIGRKPPKPPKPPKPDKKPVDWGKVISDTVAFAGSVLTVIVLVTKL